MANQAGGLRARVSSWRSTFPFLVYGPLVRFLGVLVIAVIALVLGYRGLQDYLAQPAVAKMWGQGWKNTLFYDLQLPVLSSAPTQGPGPYPVPLGIARFLAPLSTFLAAAGTLALLLSEQWRRVLAATAHRHAIVAGDDAVALELARGLRDEKWKVVFVGRADDTLAQARRLGVRGLKGDLADASTLKVAGIGRARRLYACASDSTVNLDIGTLVGRLVPRAKNRPLSAYVLVRNAELGVALQARQMGTFRSAGFFLDFFAIEDIAARRLFGTGDYPLIQADGRGAHVVIIGFGALGRAVLRETARRRAALGDGPPVEVAIGPATTADVATVAAAFPLINSSCRITCGDAPTPPDSGECTVFVCLDDFEESLRAGLDMARPTTNGRGRVVICVPGSSDLVATLAATRGGLLDDGTGRLSVFGVLQEACMSAIKADDFAEQLARSIHEAYVAHAKERGETEAVNPSMAPWNKLSEDLRRSNLAQAADIGVKMEAIDATVVPESEGAPEFRFTSQEIELLAQMEHERWVRDRISQGWKFGEVRDPAHKIHPDLRDWSYLSDGAREKDRDAIRELPAILRDAGFQILRLPSDA
jgi:hypothetical protein